MRRVTVFKSILWAILGFGIASVTVRMLFGLGAIANFSDATPWGIWKGVNVVPGIALAAGGFVVTAIIYVMQREEYHRYAKVSVLLAFLGYLSAATALVIELGLPWMVWHPIVYWQHHSALFEISWCVMLYLGVLFLEFLPVPLEETGKLAALRRFLTRYKIVLVILGIMISTLHQSSLGTLFLITPEKLHPLWYSSWLPVQFFVSAIAVGPLMLILAVMTISTLYRKPIEYDKLSGLGLFSVGVLAVYGLTRFIDLIATGDIVSAIAGTWATAIFWIEIALTFLVPIACLSVRRFRYSSAGLWAASVAGVLGIGLHRANIAGIMLVRTGPIYIPTIYEIMISLGIISAAILGFLFFIERFRIWEAKWQDPREGVEAPSEFDRVADVWLGTPRVAGRTIFSLILVLALSLGFAIMPDNRIRSEGIKQVKVAEARGGIDSMYVDGNTDAYGVTFAHQAHVEREGNKQSCVKCHHMNYPADEATGCYACHSSMYGYGDAFRHDWHADPQGGKLSCVRCHAEGQQRTAESAVACTECHKNMIPASATIQITQYETPAYVDAMHGVCVDCHQERSTEKEKWADLALCTKCHVDERPEYWTEKDWEITRDTVFNRVVLPEISPAGTRVDHE